MEDSKTLGKMLSKSLFHVNKRTTMAVSLGLTFTGLHALKPAVARLCVAGTYAVPMPSTARSAATDSPRFLELAAIGTHTNAWRGE